MRELWADSSSQHVVVDELLVSHDSITAASKALKKHQQQTATDHLFGFQLQGVIPKCVSETIEIKSIELWAKTIDYLPFHLFNFARKALLQVLQTAFANCCKPETMESRPRCVLRALCEWEASNEQTCAI